MKKTLLFLTFGLAVLAVSAQEKWMKNTLDGSEVQGGPTIQQRATATDFNITFTNGTSTSLYATTNAGKAVLMDFFFTS